MTERRLEARARHTVDGSQPTRLRATTGSESRRRHRKHRYIKQGYHKTERENSRRVEARKFLSGITLDSHLRTPLELAQQNQDPAIQHQYGRVTPGVEEGLMPSTAEKLHEMADNLLELYSRHSPVKMASSRSSEHAAAGSPLLNRSASLFDSGFGATPTYEQKRLGLQQIAQSKSTGCSVDGASVGGGGGGVHYCKRPMRPNPDSSLEQLHRQKGQRSRVSSCSLQFDLDVELSGGEEVSLGHFFKPLHQLSTDFDPTPFHSALGQQNHPSLPGPQQSKVFTVRGTFNEVLEQPLPSAGGPSFPWAGFKEHHGTSDVLVHYHPLCLDNSEFFVGPNISTLSVQSYRVSIIQYAKVSEVKRTINEKFSETFPHIKITLSKLRSIKKEMYTIAKERAVDLAAVAHAYVYFEKLVLMGKVHKSNRNVVAGVCLLLGAKFFMDMKKHEVKDLLEGITDEFRLSSEELIQYELPVLVALQFSLLTPIVQTFTHFESLRNRDISNK